MLYNHQIQSHTSSEPAPIFNGFNDSNYSNSQSNSNNDKDEKNKNCAENLSDVTLQVKLNTSEDLAANESKNNICQNEDLSAEAISAQLNQPTETVSNFENVDTGVNPGIEKHYNFDENGNLIHYYVEDLIEAPVQSMAKVHLEQEIIISNQVEDMEIENNREHNQTEAKTDYECENNNSNQTENNVEYVKENTLNEEEQDIISSPADEADNFQIESEEVHQFSCNICLETYYNSEQLTRHVEICHPNTFTYGYEQPHSNFGYFACNACDLVFENNEMLNIHWYQHHKESAMSSIDIKPNFFQSQNPGGKYQCTFCNSSFNKIKTLKIHTLEYHSNQDKKAANKFFSCLTCGKKLMSQRSLNRHTKGLHSFTNDYHSYQTLQENNHQNAANINIQASNKIRYNTHQNTVPYEVGIHINNQCEAAPNMEASNVQQYNLQQSNATFDMTNLDDSMTSNAQNEGVVMQPYHSNQSTVSHQNPEINTGVVQDLQQLQNPTLSHVEYQTSEYTLKNYRCPICQKTFKMQKTMSTHMEKFHHSDWAQHNPAEINQNYFEPKLNQTYFSSELNPIYSHGELKPKPNKFSLNSDMSQVIFHPELNQVNSIDVNQMDYNSELNSFKPNAESSQVNFNAEVIQTHLNTEVRALPRSNIKNECECNICGKVYSRKDSVLSHIKEVHVQKFDFECQLCHKQFISNAKLRIHLKSGHHIPLYFCCGEQFETKYKYRKHKKETLCNYNQQNQSFRNQLDQPVCIKGEKMYSNNYSLSDIWNSNSYKQGDDCISNENAMPVPMSPDQLFEKEFQAQTYQVSNHQETDINFDIPQDYSLPKPRNTHKNTSTNNRSCIVNNNNIFGQHSQQNVLLEIETNLYNTVEAPQPKIGIT